MATGAPATDRGFLDRLGWPFVMAVIGEGTLVLTHFGLDLSVEQLLAVNGFIAAVASLVARQKVTPWKPDRYADWAAEELERFAEEPDDDDDEDDETRF